jgi:hypothetical protein
MSAIAVRYMANERPKPQRNKPSHRRRPGSRRVTDAGFGFWARVLRLVFIKNGLAPDQVRGDVRFGGSLGSTQDRHFDKACRCDAGSIARDPQYPPTSTLTRAYPFTKRRAARPDGPSHLRREPALRGSRDADAR